MAQLTIIVRHAEVQRIDAAEIWMK